MLSTKKLVILSITFFLLVGVGSAEEFRVDLEGDWNQGTFSGISTSYNPGFIELYWGGNDNSNDEILYGDNQIKVNDVVSSSTETVLDLGADVKIAAVSDYDGDSNNDIAFVVNDELKYYDSNSDSIVDTNFDSVSGKVVGLDSDSDDVDEIAYITPDATTDQYIYIADIESGSETQSTSIGSGQHPTDIGEAYDIDSDGDLDIPVIDNAGYLEYYDLASDVFTEVGLSIDHTSVSGEYQSDILSIHNNDLVRNNPSDASRTSVSSSTASQLGNTGDVDGDSTKELIAYESDLFFYNLDTGSTNYIEAFSSTPGMWIDPYDRVSTGSYTSEIKTYSNKQIWNNLELDIPEMQDSSINAVVETSNDGFSTINDTTTISSISTGVNTYSIDSLDNSNSVRVQLNFNSNGGTPKVDAFSVYSTPENTPPNSPSNPSPNDGSTGISVNPTLSVDVSDPDGDSMDVSFYDVSDDSLIATDTGVSDGGTASVTWSSLNYNNDYSWYVIVDDGVETTTSSTYSFTTTYLEQVSNSQAPIGSTWIEGTRLRWVSGGTESILRNPTVVDSSSPGPIGSVWIEGSSMHWIDESGQELSLTGNVFDSGTAAPNGYTWIENDLIHYVDQSGDERVLNGN